MWSRWRCSPRRSRCRRWLAAHELDRLARGAAVRLLAADPRLRSGLPALLHRFGPGQARWPDELDAGEAMALAAEIVRARRALRHAVRRRTVDRPAFLRRGGIPRPRRRDAEDRNQRPAFRRGRWRRGWRGCRSARSRSAWTATRRRSTRASVPAPRWRRPMPPAARCAHAGLPLEVTFAPTRLNIHEAEAVIERARGFGAFRFNTGTVDAHRPRRAAVAQDRTVSRRPTQSFARCWRGRRASLTIRCRFAMIPLQSKEDCNKAWTLRRRRCWCCRTAGLKSPRRSGYVCGDLRRMTLTEAWESYRAAWRNETVIAAIRRGIADGHAPRGRQYLDVNLERSSEQCSM